MKTPYISLVIVLFITSCGLNSTSVEQVRPKITIFTPATNTIIASDSVLITGKVAPDNAILTINDNVVSTASGQFSYTAPLTSGLNMLKIQAKINEQWDLELLSLEKRTDEDEKKIIKEQEKKQQLQQQQEEIKKQKDKADQKIKEDAANSQEEYKKSAKKINYKLVMKDPNAHTGEITYAKGKILQAQAAGDGDFFLISITSDRYGYWSDNVAVYYPAKTDFIDGDIVQVWGEITGAYSYESQANYQLSVPAIKAAIIYK